MSTAAALSRQTKAVEQATPQQRSRTQTVAKANIEANPFYAIMFSESAPEAKRAEAAKALVEHGTKEFALFMEYLQSVRSNMAQEIIQLTDTTAFAQLKTVYDRLNGAVLQFEDRMTPLMEIVDAVSKLNQEGLALEAFREIKNDRAREEEFEKKRKAKNDALGEAALARERLEEENRRLAEKKGWGGLGGIKEEARIEIASNLAKINTLEQSVGSLRSELDGLDKQQQESSSKLGAFAAEKAKLREMLDITSEGHKKNQEDLVKAALNFVQTAQSELGEVRSHLGKMDDQIDGLLDANTNMTQVYAILNESIKEAEKTHQGQRTQLTPTENEDMIARTVREEKKRDIEQRIKSLDAAAVDTMSTFADLTSQAIRVGDMKSANEAQKSKAAALATRGVAGVADRLSTVLQAVSAAAINESASLASQTLQRMADSTNTVAQQESVRIAMGTQSVNDDLQKALADLSAYGEVKRQTTEITREAVTQMRANLDELQNMAKGVQDDISEGSAVHADVAGGVTTNPGPTTVKAKSPFARMAG